MPKCLFSISQTTLSMKKLQPNKECKIVDETDVLKTITFLIQLTSTISKKTMFIKSIISWFQNMIIKMFWKHLKIKLLLTLMILELPFQNTPSRAIEILWQGLFQLWNLIPLNQVKSKILWKKLSSPMNMVCIFVEVMLSLKVTS